MTDIKTALERLLGAQTVPFGPRGHAVVPRTLAESAHQISFGGTVVERDRAAESELADPLLEAEGLVGIRWTGPLPAGVGARPSLLLGIAVLRLDVSDRLAGDCVSYLSARTTGDTRLLDQQLVRGDLADAGTDLAELRILLAGPPPPPELLPWLHKRLTGVDRTLVRLLGASGFLADGPGRRAAVAELLSDAYVVGARPSELADASGITEDWS
jgi:hypothetical protein